jgi:uncharacterized membrane protein YgcG
MGRGIVVALLALAGLLCAAGMGFAAYVVSRDSVAVPVTRLQQKPQSQLTPRSVRGTKATRVAPTPGATATVTFTQAPSTVDDHGGRSRGGSGSGSGGHGGGGGGRGGGHGSDD